MATLDASTLTIPTPGAYDSSDPEKQRENQAYIQNQLWEQAQAAGYILSDGQMSASELAIFQILWDYQDDEIDQQTAYLTEMKNHLVAGGVYIDKMIFVNSALKSLPLSKENYLLRTSTLQQHSNALQGLILQTYLGDLRFNGYEITAGPISLALLGKTLVLTEP